MMYFKHFHSWLTAYGGGLGKLAIASWLLTNTMFLLCSRVPFMTLDFVRQISLGSFLGICLTIPWLISSGSGKIRLSLTPSMAMYLAALMIKETFI